MNPVPGQNHFHATFTNQQSKKPDSRRDSPSGRPSEGEAERPDHSPSLRTSAASKSTAKGLPSPAPPNPVSEARSAALTAAAFEANSPYSVDPEPDRDAYFAPARKSAVLASPSSGYSGKTTSSKSFLIPARTSARSGFSARPLPKGAPEYCSLSHADKPQPSSLILSELRDMVNLPSVRTAAVGCPAERSSAGFPSDPSPQMPSGVDTPISGVTTTHGIARQIRQRIDLLAPAHPEHRSAQQKKWQVRSHLRHDAQSLRSRKPLLQHPLEPQQRAHRIRRRAA